MAKTMRRASDEFPAAARTAGSRAPGGKSSRGGRELSNAELHARIEQLERNHGKGKPTGKGQRGKRNWAQKRLDRGKAKVKAHAKTKARNTRDVVRTGAKSDWHRNKSVVAPWLLAAPYGLVSEVALQALAQPHAAPAAVAGGALAASAAVSAASWRVWPKLRRRVPEAFRSRVQRGMLAGCAWCASMPLLAETVGQPTMWAAGMVGMVGLSARWWQHHRTGYPDGPQARADEALSDGKVREILDRWNGRVRIANGPVPGADLTFVRSTKIGSSFQIHLDPAGRITQDALQGAKNRLALALGVMAGQITIDPDRGDPGLAALRITNTAPETTYEGPVILRNGKPCHDRNEIRPGDTVDIVVGPYQDGEGVQTINVISAGSVNGGYLLGSKGSGKSLLTEAIAIALRWLGFYIIYFDGQGGASSAVLAETADWPIIDPVRGPAQLYHGVRNITAARQAELAGDPTLNNRYDYDPARPPIMVIVDECQVLYKTINPETGRTYGQDLGEEDRRYRKAGIAQLAGSQDLDLDTFGQSDVLRNGLYAGTVLVLRFMSKNHASMLPGAGTGLAPSLIPSGGGFGVAPLGERPEALWRSQVPNPKVDEPRRWMRSLERATLDPLAAAATGETDEARGEQAKANTEAARKRLEHMRSLSPRELAAYLRGQHTTVPGARPAAGTANSGGDGQGAGILRAPLPGGGARAGTESPTAAAGPAVGVLSDRQADMLELLGNHTLSTSQLADHYGVSEVSIRKDIARLEGYLTKVDRGVYRARDKSAISTN